MKIGCVVMAAGNARRFGENKLAAALDGRSLILRALEAVPAEQFEKVVVVTQYPEVMRLVGEFHFGTLDRGMFSAGLAPVVDQRERAMSLTRFVQGALAHPSFVGAHWFQFRDQPLTGRFDGEGYQIGFVDVADTPYREMTSAARAIGEHMYRYRQAGRLTDWQ